MPSLHATLGASGASRWMNCPGSVRMSEGIPSTTNEAAIEGTRAHYVCERALLDGKDAAAYAGTKLIEPVVGEFEVTDEMVEHVQTYLDHVHSLNTNPKDSILKVENRVSLEKVWKGMFGTTDAVLVESFGTLHVIDFKYGMNPVEVEENPQLMFYGLGSLLEHEDACVENVKLHVVQPRAIHPDGPIRVWETTPERLMEFGKELRRAAKETIKPDSVIRAGKWCQYCPAAGKCPALHDQSMEAAMVEFDDTNTLQLPAVDQLTPDQINRLISHKKQITAFIDAVEQRALSELMEGEKIEGLKVVRGRSSRYWMKDLDIAEELMLRNASLEEVTETKVLSVSQIEKKFGKEMTEGLFEKREGKLTVAPVTDRRKAIEFNKAEDDFDSIPVNDDMGFLE